MPSSVCCTLMYQSTKREKPSKLFDPTPKVRITDSRYTGTWMNKNYILKTLFMTLLMCVCLRHGFFSSLIWPFPASSRTTAWRWPSRPRTSVQSPWRYSFSFSQCFESWSVLDSDPFWILICFGSLSVLDPYSE